jgi:hypothetical protein
MMPGAGRQDRDIAGGNLQHFAALAAASSELAASGERPG